jgi:Flp pilus assembly protein TadD
MSPAYRPAARRILQFAALSATLVLGACQSFPGFGETDVAATSATQPILHTSPPADQIKDDVGLGKQHFRSQNYGLAEAHFRRAVESEPRNPEAWLGLAASYDELKRWELADRAYGEAFRLTGPTAEFLNNRGYSYLLRGDVRQARRDLAAAAAKRPDSELIQNNLQALNAPASHRG